MWGSTRGDLPLLAAPLTGPDVRWSSFLRGVLHKLDMTDLWLSNLNSTCGAKDGSWTFLFFIKRPFPSNQHYHVCSTCPSDIPTPKKSEALLRPYWGNMFLNLCGSCLETGCPWFFFVEGRDQIVMGLLIPNCWTPQVTVCQRWSSKMRWLYQKNQMVHELERSLLRGSGYGR